jgi:parallel beta-helix repeat protein
MVLSRSVGAVECDSEPTDGCEVNKSLTFTTNNYNLTNGIKITGDNLILDCNGATLNGTYQNGFEGINANGRNNITIQNCTIQNYALVIFVQDTDNLRVVNNIFRRILEDGLYFRGINNNVFIFNNSFYDIRQESVAFYTCTSSSNVTVSNNYFDYVETGVYLDNTVNAMIVNNSIINNFYSGIYVDKSSNVIVSNNIVEDIHPNPPWGPSTDGGIAIYGASHDIVVSENIVKNIIYTNGNNPTGGISLSSSPTNVTVIDNIVTGSEYGITIKRNSNYNFISNNTIIGSTYDAISIFNSNPNPFTLHDNIIRDNFITGNSYEICVGCYHNKGGLQIYAENVSDNEIYHNIFINNTWGSFDYSVNNSTNNGIVGNYSLDYTGGNAYLDGNVDVLYNVSCTTNSSGKYPFMVPFESYEADIFLNQRYITYNVPWNMQCIEDQSGLEQPSAPP